MQKSDAYSLKKSFGKTVREQRKVLGLSQEVLAEKLNINIRTLGKIENGHTFVSAETLCELSKIFNLPVKSFFNAQSLSDNESKLNIIIDKLKSGGTNKIDYYYKIINLIDEKYNDK